MPEDFEKRPEPDDSACHPFDNSACTNAPVLLSFGQNK